MANPKIKIIRVVTSAEVVSFHLKNFLLQSSSDFATIVIGNGVTQYQAQFPEIVFVDVPIAREIRPLSDLRVLLQLIQLFRLHQPDIVHSIMPKSGLLAALAGFVARVPLRLHTFTGQVWATRTGPFRDFLIFLDRLVVFLNTVCLTDSPTQSQFLFENGIRTKDTTPLPVIHQGSLSGIDLDQFNIEKLLPERARLRLQYMIPVDAFVFIYVGRKNKEKGVNELLLAFHEVQKSNPSVYLFFVGPEEADPQTYTSEAKNILSQNRHVKSVGLTDSPEKYLMASDVFCLPSYREGFGTVVIEAAALGVPSIGSRIPGLMDSIQDGKTGLLFNPHSVDAIISSMRQIMSDPESLQIFSKNCVSSVKNNFDTKVLYRKTLEFYRHLQKNRPSPL